MSNLSTIGASVPAGSRDRIVLIFPCTSCCATSRFFSSTNVMTTEVIPSLVVERNSSIPEIVLTASSIILVTPVSISSTLVPGRVVVTVTIGRSTLGNRSTPILLYASIPSTTGNAISIVVKTGRRTQSSETVIREG